MDSFLLPGFLQDQGEASERIIFPIIENNV
jgi:hypothetical protein